MGHVVIARDGAADGRRMALRDRHLAVITPMAADGRLALGVPLFAADGRVHGSLMVLQTDRAGLDAYLAEEPFAAEGVWAAVEIHPFRIAPLPYRPLPGPDAPLPSRVTHTVLIARDAPGSRRDAVRDAHLRRVRPLAEAGLLVLGGAILDAPEGRMTGSVAVTAHPTEAEARAFWAEDPYLREGVWGETAWFGTRFAPLPYRPLPGGSGA